MEQISLNDASGRYNFINLLNAAEFEGNMISKRVSDSLEKRKAEGNQLGKPSFGFQVGYVDSKRTFIPNEEEKLIVNFIVACRTKNTTLLTLDSLMNAISKDKKYQSIEFDSEEDFIISKLDFKNIADLLNEYCVKNRKDKPWTKIGVLRIYKNYTIQNKLQQPSRSEIEEPVVEKIIIDEK